MALATKCPHCNTIFRVAADQLKLRGGIVRCGTCSEVFDGNAALVAPAPKPTHVMPEVAVDTHAAPAVIGYHQGAPVDFELDFDDTAPPAPPVTEPAPAPSVWRTYAGQPPAEPEPDLPAAAPAAEDAAIVAVAIDEDFTADDEPEAAAEEFPLADGGQALQEPDAADVEALPDVAPHEGDHIALADGAPAEDEGGLAVEESASAEETLTAAPAAPDEQPPAADADADGRIEPTLDTPQEHLVAAALDDAHHLEDLPPAEEPEAPAAIAPEPEPLHDEVRDETALHAVAAVNIDARDDGEAIPDDEPAEAVSGAATDADDLDHADLSFVKRHDRSQKYGRAIKVAMAFCIPLLLAGLVLQAATTFRDTLAANYPQLKPALASVCEALDCKIGLPAHIDALSIEQGELQTMAEDTLSFTTVLRNQSRTVQAWPHIELTLNDNADKPVLRRVFAPREYLASRADADKGFSARTEQSVKLYFELKTLKASGYHIAIFYP